MVCPETYVSYSVINHFELDAGVEGVEQCLEGKVSYRKRKQQGAIDNHTLV